MSHRHGNYAGIGIVEGVCLHTQLAASESDAKEKGSTEHTKAMQPTGCRALW